MLPLWLAIINSCRNEGRRIKISVESRAFGPFNAYEDEAGCLLACAQMQLLRWSHMTDLRENSQKQLQWLAKQRGLFRPSEQHQNGWSTHSLLIISLAFLRNAPSST